MFQHKRQRKQQQQNAKQMDGYNSTKVINCNRGGGMPRGG